MRSSPSFAILRHAWRKVQAGTSCPCTSPRARANRRPSRGTHAAQDALRPACSAHAALLMPLSSCRHSDGFDCSRAQQGGGAARCGRRMGVRRAEDDVLHVARVLGRARHGRADARHVQRSQQPALGDDRATGPEARAAATSKAQRRAATGRPSGKSHGHIHSRDPRPAHPCCGSQWQTVKARKKRDHGRYSPTLGRCCPEYCTA